MKLVEIYKDDCDDIYKLTNERNVMKYVGNSKIWSDDKVERFIEYNYSDRKTKRRQNFYYKIIDDNIFKGIIGYHPFQKFKGMFLTVMILSEFQNKGVYSKALNLLKQKIKSYDKLYSLVRVSNDRMNEISRNKYYFVKRIRIKDESFNLYAIYLRPYTYRIESNVLNKDKINEIMEGWKTSKNPDFLHIDYDFYNKRELWGLKSTLKNVIQENKRIVYKDELYKNLVGEYLVQNLNFNVSDTSKVKKFIKRNKIYIVKPVKSFSGVGIFVVDSYSSFKKKINSADKRYKNYVIQEYIKNPLLYKNHKFHLRVYVFLYYDSYSKTKNMGYLEFFEVAIAKKEYNLDYTDKDAHDTHFGDSQKNIFFPRDFELSEKIIKSIYSQIDKIVKDIKEISTSNCYSENKRCYEVFGMDLMIDEEFRVNLIELNSRIGIPEDEIRYYDEPLNITIFKNEMNIVKSIFPGGEKFRNDIRWI